MRGKGPFQPYQFLTQPAQIISQLANHCLLSLNWKCHIHGPEGRTRSPEFGVQTWNFLLRFTLPDRAGSIQFMLIPINSMLLSWFILHTCKLWHTHKQPPHTGSSLRSPIDLKCQERNKGRKRWAWAAHTLQPGYMLQGCQILSPMQRTLQTVSVGWGFLKKSAASSGFISVS